MSKFFAAAVLLCAVLAGCRSNPSKPLEGESASLSNLMQLTHDFDRAGEAYFSPDMQWIIFQATPKGQQQYQMYLAHLLYSKDAATRLVGYGEAIQISPQPSRNTCGFFSPDGKSLIFASTAGKEDPTEPSSGYQRQGGSYRWEFPAGMAIYRFEGWRDAISSATTKQNFATRALTSNNAYDAECAYSPDGNCIVFCSNRTGDLELWAMRSDGSHPVQLTHTKGYDGGPFFSPDGKRIVYRSDRAGNDLLQIYVADLTFDASGNITGIANERQLTNDSYVNWGPYWHPDGRHIIYASSAQGHTNYELYLMRDDGSHKIRITYTDGFDGLPVFSPDGHYLMWSSKRTADHTTQVFLAHFNLPPGA